MHEMVNVNRVALIKCKLPEYNNLIWILSLEKNTGHFLRVVSTGKARAKKAT